MRAALKLGALVDAHYRDRANLHRILELGQVVQATTALVHELQRERGLSTGFVASAGARFDRELAAQRTRCDQALAHALDAWDGPRSGPALTSTLASVRFDLADLGRLREDVTAQAIPAASVAQGFTALIDRLMVVVAEAPGTSPHPQVTLALIALFHFVLAKEYTGQERALGSAICAQGALEPFQAERLGRIGRQRLEALEVFSRHATADQLASWATLGEAPAFGHLDALRGALADPEVRTPDAAVWFEASTTVIDLLRTFEVGLLADLDQLCLQVLAEARSAWEDDREAPDAREALVLRRLEKTQTRLLAERQTQRRGRPTPPAPDLASGSGRAVETAHRWKRDLVRLEALVNNLETLTRQARLLALDATIEAVGRAEVAAGAQKLTEALEEATHRVDETRRILDTSADRAIEALEAFHSTVLSPNPEEEQP